MIGHICIASFTIANVPLSMSETRKCLEAVMACEAKDHLWKEKADPENGTPSFQVVGSCILRGRHALSSISVNTLSCSGDALTR